MFVHSFCNFPGAAHTLGEDNQIASTELNKLIVVAIWVHLHLALQEVAGLLGVVRPWELTGLAYPLGPGPHSQQG